jgi:ribose 5-phosphate isomerase A
MNQDQLKALVAIAAKDEVMQTVPPGQVIGIGTGSTANLFIDALAEHKSHFSGAVSSSVASTERLKSHGFEVFEANEVLGLPVYVDGADEIDPQGHMIKGGGAALTREKIVAQLAQRFICICDGSKQVPVLGDFPLPIEVIPMAWAQIKRSLEKLGGQVTLRMSKSDPDQALVTDNQAWILDVRNLKITQPVMFEEQINQIPGVICNGIFAKRKADLLLVGLADGVKRITF